MSKQQQKKWSVPTASKAVQCEVEAPAPPEVEPVSSSNSTEAKVISSLQGEIARLAQENTVLTQRQAVSILSAGIFLPPLNFFCVEVVCYEGKIGRSLFRCSVIYSSITNNAKMVTRIIKTNTTGIYLCYFISSKGVHDYLSPISHATWKSSPS